MYSKEIKPRDANELFMKYRNLRNGLLSSKRRMWGQSIDGAFSDMSWVKDDLYSYINEQFITLVNEYDVHSNIDFPGYVKNKLGLRTQHSYIKSYYRHLNREIPSSTSSSSDEDDDNNQSPLDVKSSTTPDTLVTENIYAWVDNLDIDTDSLSKLDWDIIYFWSEWTGTVSNTKAMAKEMSANYDYEYADILNEMSQLRLRFSRKVKKIGSSPQKEKLIERSVKETGLDPDYLWVKYIYTNSNLKKKNKKIGPLTDRKEAYAYTKDMHPMPKKKFTELFDQVESEYKKRKNYTTPSTFEIIS